MIPIETHIVPPATEPERLSDYAPKVFSTIPSRKGIKKAIKRGAIRVDGKTGDTGDWVRPGQKLELLDIGRTTPKPYEMELEIVFEDEHLAAVNKPAGLPSSGNQFKTLENALLHNLKPSPEADALPWPLPVHRLDAPTSGLLIAAKTYEARIQLGQQFENKQVKKQYRAIALGELPESGTIDHPLDGKPAQTHYQRLRLVRSLKCEWLSLLALHPTTGRTHQLRRHLAAEGHPILGDPLYTENKPLLKHKGLFLCAVGLQFTHPHTEKMIRLEIPPPDKFTTFLDRSERRWGKFRQQ